MSYKSKSKRADAKVQWKEWKTDYTRTTVSWNLNLKLSNETEFSFQMIKVFKVLKIFLILIYSNSIIRLSLISIERECVIMSGQAQGRPRLRCARAQQFTRARHRMLARSFRVAPLATINFLAYWIRQVSLWQFSNSNLIIFIFVESTSIFIMYIASHFFIVAGYYKGFLEIPILTLKSNLTRKCQLNVTCPGEIMHSDLHHFHLLIIFHIYLFL